MNNLKLTLTNFGVLDTSSSISIPLNFNINDIADISSRGGVWSKTVKIYGTNNNNAILGTVFDVNSTSLFFNQKHKEECIITIDGQVAFEGIFQLTNVSKIYDNDNFTLVYDCYLKSETSNFYTIIDGKYLTDLDVSEYNHTINFNTVYSSMTGGTSTDGYQYFLGYNSDSDSTYKANLCSPALYCKVIFDEIFTSAGYQYDFPELYDLNFDKLIIPFNGEILNPSLSSNDPIFLYDFRAGFQTAETYPTLSILNNGGSPVSLVDNISTINYRVDDDTLNNWYDRGGRYSTIYSEYDIENFDGIMEFNARLNFDQYIQPNGFTGGTIATAVDVSIETRLEIALYDASGAFIDTLNSQVVNTTDLIADQNSSNFISFIANEPNYIKTIQADVSGVYDSIYYPTAKYVRVILRDVLFAPPGYIGIIKDDGGFIRYYDTYITYEALPQADPEGHFTNKPTGGLSEGSPVNMNDVLPKNIKQSQFISGLVQMFNLYIKEDKNIDKKLIIRTRDRFYEDGIDISWEEKVDKKTIQVQPLSNTQNKVKVFTYKEDSADPLAKAYKTKTNEIFGQVKYVFDNEFIFGESKVSPLFSSTFQIVVNGKNLPFINAKNPKNNIRILYVGNIVNGDWNYVVPNVEVSANNFTDIKYSFRNYRHVGHLFPNSYNPTEDLNFGVQDYYSHNYSTITNNNLFNRFYYKQYNIFENGYKLKAKFNLNYSDVAQLNFNERIYINGSWWNINLINDFDPNNNELTEVELISSDSVIASFIPNNNVFLNNSSLVNEKTLNTEAKLADTNTYGKDVFNVDVKGNYNLIQGGANKASVIGDYNKVKGVNNLVVGNKNNVYGENVVVLGANYKTFTQSNTVNVGTLIKVIDIISAGRDEVINLFPDNSVINFISAGRDEVKGIGSETIESVIIAGRDSV